MERIEIWSKLASRAARVLLVRKDVSYAGLASELSRLGLDESARSVEGKIQRGTFRFSFFLQSLVAVQADCPAHWDSALKVRGDWEHRAAVLVRHELELRPWLTWEELARRLSVIGAQAEPDALAAQIRGGAFPTTLFLQCAVVSAFEGLELFLDRSDLRAAAKQCMLAL
ncbi:DUF6471 domain-containing protein [Paraburkholderia sp. BR10954]|uniref:DUF6471 domain-containing protein n=1 Tax=Paraburkholderia sp. BR10954 TaxID=3236995 RepID=UPI0034D38900